MFDLVKLIRFKELAIFSSNILKQYEAENKNKILKYLERATDSLDESLNQYKVNESVLRLIFDLIAQDKLDVVDAIFVDRKGYIRHNSLIDPATEYTDIQLGNLLQFFMDDGVGPFLKIQSGDILKSIFEEVKDYNADQRDCLFSIMHIKEMIDFLFYEPDSQPLRVLPCRVFPTTGDHVIRRGRGLFVPAEKTQRSKQNLWKLILNEIKTCEKTQTENQFEKFKFFIGSDSSAVDFLKSLSDDQAKLLFETVRGYNLDQIDCLRSYINTNLSFITEQNLLSTILEQIKTCKKTETEDQFEKFKLFVTATDSVIINILYNKPQSASLVINIFKDCDQDQINNLKDFVGELNINKLLNMVEVNEFEIINEIKTWDKSQLNNLIKHFCNSNIADDVLYANANKAHFIIKGCKNFTREEEYSKLKSKDFVDSLIKEVETLPQKIDKHSVAAPHMEPLAMTEQGKSTMRF